MFTGTLQLELEIEEKHTFELQTSDKIITCKFKKAHFRTSVYVLPYVCWEALGKLYSEIITNNFCFKVLSMQLALTLDHVEDLQEV